MSTAHRDSRFSTPGAGGAARGRVQQGLGEDLYRVVTVRAAGRPHVTPLAVVTLPSGGGGVAPSQGSECP